MRGVSNIRSVSFTLSICDTLGCTGINGKVITAATIFHMEFIAIIVNAMQTFTDQETRDTIHAVDAARDHIEADLHQEVSALRAEIVELKALLQASKNGHD